jgi:hypothetical protein
VSQYIFGQWQDIALGVGSGLVIVLVLMVIAWAMEKHDEWDRNEATRIMREHFQMSIDNARAREQEKERAVAIETPFIELDMTDIERIVKAYLEGNGLHVRASESGWVDVDGDDACDSDLFLRVPVDVSPDQSKQEETA